MVNSKITEAERKIPIIRTRKSTKRNLIKDLVECKLALIGIMKKYLDFNKYGGELVITDHNNELHTAFKVLKIENSFITLKELEELETKLRNDI